MGGAVPDVYLPAPLHEETVVKRLSKRTAKRLIGFAVAAFCFWQAWAAYQDSLVHPNLIISMACGAFAGLGIGLVALSSGFVGWLLDD